jgi:hypothetical protein
MTELVPACVWRISPELLLALDTQFGEPVDAYVNGSQVWLREDGPNEVTLEWRLHPVAGFKRPARIGTYELFETIVFALRAAEEPAAPLDQLWDGLEAFIGFGDESEPALLAQACATSLGLAPDAFGMVDHQGIGDRWESTLGKISVIADLLQQLEPAASAE